MPSAPSPSAARNPDRWLVLVACIVAVLMVVIDSGLLNLITPSIQAEFGTPANRIGLLASISTLMLAAFTLGGGTLGDLYGRRRLLLIGTGGMVAAAILSIVAPSDTALTAIRAIDGIFEALVSPLALAIITVTFDAEERPRALGLYGAVLGVMGGLSALVAQALNQTFGWRSTFALTIVLGLITIFLMLRFVRDSRSPDSQKLDGPGILLCAAGLLALVFGISQASGPGGFLQAGVLGPASAGLVILSAFLAWESRQRAPALRLSLFQQPAFSLGTLLILLFSLAQTAVYFHLSNYFQVLLRQSPIQSALMLLPLTLSIFAFSILAGSLAERFAARSLIVVGTALFALALFLLHLTVRPDLSLATVLVPMLLLGSGMAMANIPRMNALLSSAPSALAGTASATNNAAMQLGNAMGIAVSVALVTSFGRDAYLRELRGAGLDSEQIGKATSLLKQLLASDVHTIADQYAIAPHKLAGLIGNYQAAFTAGITQMLLILALLMLAMAALLWVGLRSLR